ncbi:MAG: hypothetical protein LUG96_11100 [Tannerellaceae bacterium]|nr:hypothetical protein [Tannerellaceae bacterium]
MKKIHFQSFAHLMVCLVWAAITIACLAGAFSNPCHFFTFGMSAFATGVAYKSW